MQALAVREDVEALRDVASDGTFRNALAAMRGIGIHVVTGGVSTRQVNAYYDKRADKAVREDLIRWAGLGGCRGRAAPGWNGRSHLGWGQPCLPVWVAAGGTRQRSLRHRAKTDTRACAHCSLDLSAVQQPPLPSPPATPALAPPAALQGV